MLQHRYSQTFTPREMKTYSHKHLYMNIHGSIFCNIQQLQTTHMTLKGWIVKQGMESIRTMGYDCLLVHIATWLVQESPATGKKPSSKQSYHVRPLIPNFERTTLWRHIRDQWWVVWSGQWEEGGSCARKGTSMDPVPGPWFLSAAGVVIHVYKWDKTAWNSACTGVCAKMVESD